MDGFKINDINFRFVIQRAAWAEVEIEGVSQGRIEPGLVVLFGVGQTTLEGDPQGVSAATLATQTELVAILDKCAEKILGLRIFQDAEGKMNLSVREVQGGIYVVSQFTLFADCKKGFRPGFSAAAKPELANAVYELFLERVQLKTAGTIPLCTGRFGADMKVSLLNDGPVTIPLEANLKGIK